MFWNGAKKHSRESSLQHKRLRWKWARLGLESLEERLAPAGLSLSQQQLVAAYGQLPLSFLPNEGQTASQVQYLSQGNGYSLFLTPTGSVLSLQQPVAATGLLQSHPVPGTGLSPPSTTSMGVALAINLVGSNPKATVSGQDPLPGLSNYFIGNDAGQWHTNIANYGKVAYQNVYPGVNLVYYGNQQQLEYDFVVAPGANPGLIRFNVQGAESIALDPLGNLLIHTALGDVQEKAPSLYQVIGGEQQPVSGQFVLLGTNEVGFQVGAYNNKLPLVIDPVLGYSTYLGGSADNYGYGIAVDGSGNSYITGYTQSTNFPTTTGAFQTTSLGSYEAFITKLNAGATNLVYSTYLGGNSYDIGYGIAVDGSGNAYITGVTYSSNFPTTTGAFQTTLGGTSNAFVTKLNASGTALVYSTYLGGSGTDQANGIALDSSGDACITGQTTSSNFPTTSGAFKTTYGGGNSDAFVTEVNANGTGLAYSTYLGGTAADYGDGIAVDASGDAYVTGYTTSTNFPTTSGAFQTTHASDGNKNDAFVTKLNSTGTALVYSTYLGGTVNDYGYGIALDSSGNAYVTGYTTSSNFPTTTGAFQTTNGGGGDAFVTKLNPSGTALVYSTYLGGTGADYGLGIAVDVAGNAYVTGSTISTNFPTTSGAFQTSLNGVDKDAFISKLNGLGTALLYSTYLGGNAIDSGLSIALGGSENPYVTGYTISTNFPTTTGAYQTTKSGSYDVFVAEFDFGPTITTTSLPNWTVNQAYSQTIATIGGIAPVTFAVTAGNLPTGLSLNASTGAITGTPTTTSGSPFNFTITATDAEGLTASQAYTVVINPALSISPTTLPAATATVAYNQTITVSGGTVPYVTFTVTNFNGGTTGLTTSSITTSASAGTITIAGTPTAAGSASFTVNITDSAGATLTQNYTLTVQLFPTTTTLTDNGPNASIFGQSVSFTVNETSGVPNGETVTLEDASNSNAVVGTGTLTSDSATISVSNLSVGTHNIFAVYASDGSFAGSQSGQVVQVVEAGIWNNFNGNPQHTGISTVAAQPTDQILWQTSINLQGSYFWHTGEPVFTPNDTVIVPVKVTSGGNTANATNFELEAFNGNTGALLWTATSPYVTPSYSWLPPYQPVYDPVTNCVYFPGPGGTLYYISNPDNPGSSTPTPNQEAFYGTSNYTANESAYNSSIYINTPLTVDNSGNVFFGFTETGSNPSGIGDGGIGRVSATGAGTYVTTGVAVGTGSGSPALGSAPAVSNDGSIVYVAMADSSGSYLVGVDATTLAHKYAVALSVPNSGTGVYLINQSTAAPMVAPDGTVFMGVFANNYDGSRGFMTHYSANLATEYTPGAFGWDDTASIIPTSMVPSYTGSSSYLILTKYNNYVAGETGSTGGNGVNEIAVLDPYATQTDPNNDPNPNMLVMKQILTATSPTEDSGYINNGYPDATREWCTNGTAVDQPPPTACSSTMRTATLTDGTWPPTRSPRPSRSPTATANPTRRRLSAPTVWSTL